VFIVVVEPDIPRLNSYSVLINVKRQVGTKIEQELFLWDCLGVTVIRVGKSDIAQECATVAILYKHLII